MYFRKNLESQVSSKIKNQINKNLMLNISFLKSFQIPASNTVFCHLSFSCTAYYYPCWKKVQLNQCFSTSGLEKETPTKGSPFP